MKSLKDCTDEEIHERFQRALDEARRPEVQYAEIRTIISGGKVKFMTMEKPVT